MKTPQERTNKELLELFCQLHHRLLLQSISPGSGVEHVQEQARKEVEKELMARLKPDVFCETCDHRKPNDNEPLAEIFIYSCPECNNKNYYSR